MARIKHGTLVASTVATVTLDLVDSGRIVSRQKRVEVINRDGAAEIYFTVDGTTPTVAGDDCFVLPAAMGSLEVGAPKGTPTVVKLISSGTPTYSVGPA
jgi:hypothetical protein